MKFTVLAALFAVAGAEDEVTMPFTMDQMATMISKEGDERMAEYRTILKDKWQTEDLAKGTTQADFDKYWLAYTTAADTWAKDAETAANVSGTQLDDLKNELWEQRLKLDVQQRANEELEKTIHEELLAENPEIKEKFDSFTDEEKAAFKNSVGTMTSDLTEASQKKAEKEIQDKASAGIFALDDAAQLAYDEAQAQLKEAAEAAATEQAQAAVEALKQAKEDGTYKDDGLSVADKIKAMEEANSKRVEDELKQADAAKAQMEDLKKLGFFETGADKLSDEKKKELLDKKQKNAEDYQKYTNPVPGKTGSSCAKAKAKITGSDVEVEVRPPCSEGYCCGTAWSVGIEEDISLGEEYKNSKDPLKQRHEVCGESKMDNPLGLKDDDGNVLKVAKLTFQHMLMVANSPTPVELQFACIDGAKKIAAGAVAVLSAYMAM